LSTVAGQSVSRLAIQPGRPVRLWFASDKLEVLPDAAIGGMKLVGYRKKSDSEQRVEVGA